MRKKNAKIIFSGVDTESNNQFIDNLKTAVVKNELVGFSNYRKISELNSQYEKDESFILFYCSPEYQLSQYENLDNENIGLLDSDKLLIDWKNESQLTLNFYLSNIENAVLVDVEQCIVQMDVLIKKLNNKFNYHLKSKSYDKKELSIKSEKTNAFDSNEAFNGIVKSIMLNNLSEQYEIQGVYEEIASAADLFASNQIISFEERAAFESENAMQLLKGVASSLLFIKDENKNLKVEDVGLKNDREIAHLQIKQLQEELDALVEQKGIIETDQQALEKQNAELSAEGELSLLQIQQLQEELEALVEQKGIIETDQQALEKQNAELSAEGELSLLQIQQLQEELESTFSQNIELENSNTNRNTNLESKVSDLECENEIALLQIQQLQEELEFYFIKYQSSSNWKPVPLTLDIKDKRFESTFQLSRLLRA